MGFGRKEALGFLVELETRRKQSQTNAAIWGLKFLAENYSHSSLKYAVALASCLNLHASTLPKEDVSHSSKQPYYRRHAKGWNK